MPTSLTYRPASAPQITFVIFNLIGCEEFPKLVLECDHLIVLGLIFDIGVHQIRIFRTYTKPIVSRLPFKQFYSDAFLVEALFNPSGVLSARNRLDVPKPQAEAWGYISLMLSASLSQMSEFPRPLRSDAAPIEVGHLRRRFKNAIRPSPPGRRWHKHAFGRAWYEPHCRYNVSARGTRPKSKPPEAKERAVSALINNQLSQYFEYPKRC